MPTTPAKPRDFKGVMISSTFMDLKPYRDALAGALRKSELVAIGMEDYVPSPDDDEISSSMKMVEKGHAFIGIISQRCGGIYKCPDRNPENHSICRLEFEKAQELKRPTLVFIMSDTCPVPAKDVEKSTAKRKKLEAHREAAKKGRIWVEFNSLEDFKEKAIHAVARLRTYLDEHEAEAKQKAAPAPEPNEPKSTAELTSVTNPIPHPPALYAEPRYLGSHAFVGRQQQLDTLDDWASPADAHPVLLFEAIGGSGKSMLTWHWVQQHAPALRKDAPSKDAWAGFFWYSFYERGAVMADFCCHALAYITGAPLEEWQKKKTTEMAPVLLHHLQARPWLFVLDGLERVLVAYNRYDAAQVQDEEAGKTDQIASRDPCAAIRPEDDELLRALAAAAPSKILITSRLIPRTLLNSASQSIPGVLRERLPGLRPADAEAMFCNCGVKGNSAAIQTYLKAHCDCHPLTIGALAGLVVHYRPAPGDFDRWTIDPEAGGKLDFADLDLTQKRNHILLASIKDLPPGSRRLLSLLALLSEAVAYDTLEALNPDLPEKPEEVEKTQDSKTCGDWANMDEDQQKEELDYYTEYKADYEAYLQALNTYQLAVKAARKPLGEAIDDLEKRGILQFEDSRYDLHPVVRGVAAGGVESNEKQALGQRMVDYFSARPHPPYEQAETLDDVRDGMHVVRAFLQMRRFEEACAAYAGGLANALSINLEAHAEKLSLLKPFFPEGWSMLPNHVDTQSAAYLANEAGLVLGDLGQKSEEMAARTCALRAHIETEQPSAVSVNLLNFGVSFGNQMNLANKVASTLGHLWIWGVFPRGFGWLKSGVFWVACFAD